MNPVKDFRQDNKIISKSLAWLRSPFYSKQKIQSILLILPKKVSCFYLKNSVSCLHLKWTEIF